MKNNNNKLFIGIIILFIILVSILAIINITGKKDGTLSSLTYKEVKEKTNNKEDFILVVSQSTCSHCATYKPKLEIIAQKYGINIFYIDYDKEKEKEKFLNEFDLNGSTPVTIFIKKGKQTSLLDRLEGDVSKEKAIEKFKKMGFIKE